jgi:hypothetical protein
VQLGLKTAYDEDDEFRSWVKMTMVLPLVPIDSIIDANIIIETEKPSKYQEVETYLDYIFKTWIGDEEEGILSEFKHELWNHYDNKIRTNNHLEGFHSKLKRLVKSPKPHIFKIINVIKHQEELTRIKHIRLNVQEHIQANKEQVKNAEIKLLKQKFELDKSYMLKDYLKDLSIYAKNFYSKKN